MEKEKGSINFAVGIYVDGPFNMFDNDYITPIVYRLENPGDTITIVDDDQLNLCTNAELSQIV